MVEVEDTVQPLEGPSPDSRFRGLSLEKRVWASGKRASSFRPCFVNSVHECVYELAMLSLWLTLGWPPFIPYLSSLPLPLPLAAASTAHPYLALVLFDISWLLSFLEI